MRHVGLFGGSFNPPHLCHTMTSLWAMHTHPLDEVWWMPTYQHAFGKSLLPFEDRVELCEKATRLLTNVHISDVERQLGGESRTVDTVTHLRKVHPNTQFWLIIGSDILAETHKWKNWDGLMEMVNLVIIGRAGYEAHVRPEMHVSFTLPGVSSTAIREALSKGPEGDKSLLEDWVDRQVLAQIEAKGFYRG